MLTTLFSARYRSSVPRPGLAMLTLIGATFASVVFAAERHSVSNDFISLLTETPAVREQALLRLTGQWEESYVPMALETLYLSQDLEMTGKLVELLQRKTGQTFGFDMRQWQEWLWNRPERKHPRYEEFKAKLYGLIDPRFSHYFSADRPQTIRLDEVVWGGVRQDGIPPLREPKMIEADAADYLEADNVVFGIEINGDARAYPKRIMGWHEMFVDQVGGVPVAGVYCTLCGAMILYKTQHGATNHRLGTSGFLYRSNKLMYDRDTHSLWNTLWGTPVIGPLVGKAIELERLSIVTTTWGEWLRRHPRTRVLSLDTGYQRDYREGVAYFEYFATDELMFTVPRRDTRLPNKDEVLGLVFPHSPDKPLAITARYLYRHPIYQDAVETLRFVVLTDPSGANRVYETGDRVFVSWDGDQTVRDREGNVWKLSEQSLTASDGKSLRRLPAHRSFWFGWFAAYPHTRLVR